MQFLFPNSHVILPNTTKFQRNCLKNILQSISLEIEQRQDYKSSSLSLSLILPVCQLFVRGKESTYK